MRLGGDAGELEDVCSGLALVFIGVCSGFVAGIVSSEPELKLLELLDSRLRFSGVFGRPGRCVA